MQIIFMSLALVVAGLSATVLWFRYRRARSHEELKPPATPTSALLLRAAAVVGGSLIQASPAIGQPAAVACPWPEPSQFLADRPSPPDSVVFAVGGSSGKLCYSRPSARGRRVFGQLVELGKVWRTGANEPTMLLLPVVAHVAGIPLQPGRYILMTIPGSERWIITLSTSDASSPAEMFNALTEVGRAQIPAEATEAPIEKLTFRAAPDSAGVLLILEWERTRLRIPVKELSTYIPGSLHDSKRDARLTDARPRNYSLTRS